MKRDQENIVKIEHGEETLEFTNTLEAVKWLDWFMMHRKPKKIGIIATIKLEVEGDISK